ncbi:hypothetical protein C8F04DRAFT_1078683 [Mycena alexandri]|uniref:NmrA-like domain-containing protein n=1 Tax=Mycena alexandri TaxID=1745969 RepID=A0AAD6T8I9_9AGAR|nr:hypothetical protein C8F04DRAFT_1078683 [Mycena alexandri]
MTSPRIVSVFGATGLQGSAVVDALLKDGTFLPRAITRDPNSATSQKLKARGAQVVRGDSLNKASLVKALEGSEAVFAVTVVNVPHVDGKDEVTQGRNMVDAAKEVGVKFFIWTGLPGMKRITGGKLQNCTHFDDKEIVQEYLQSSGLAHASLMLPAFLENLWSYDILKKTPTGYTFSLPLSPSKKHQFAWIGRDVPAAALALLKNYTDAAKFEEINGKAYAVVNAKMSNAELAEKMGRVLGVEVTYTQSPPMGIAEMDEMWEFVNEYEGYYATPIPNPDLLALGMKFSTVDEFVEVEVKARYGQ